MKHANAKAIEVTLARTGSEVRVDVRDDGRGFPGSMPQKPGPFGLFDMRDRARLLGGTLAVQSEP